MRHLNALIATLIMLLSHNGLANTFKTEKWTTKNGVRVVFYQAMEVPMLDISLAFAAGSAYDQNQYGLSSLTAKMLNEGNAGQDATTIAETLANTGAQFDTTTSRDMVILNLRTLTSKETLAQSTTTFAQIINHPDFPDKAFEREQQQLLMAIEQTDESPDEVATLNFFEKLYHQHPYAHPVNGTLSTMKSLTKKQAVDFYKKYYLANNAVLVMVGAIDTHDAHQLADKLTQELPKGTPASPIAKAAQLTQAEKINIPFPSSQTTIRLGQIGIDHQNPNYFPLMVGNYILGGGGLTSRLSIEVREKRGLTYGVSSQLVPMPGEGPFFISLATENNQAPTALKITKETLDLFISKGPDKEELVAAKKYLTGSFPMSLASNRNIANLLLRMTFYQLPDNYLNTYVERINAVTDEEIKQAFQQQVNPDKLLLVMVGQS